MPLTPGQRIDLINESAILLDKPDWAEQDLIRDQHSLPTQESWATRDQRSYVMEMIKGAPDNRLSALHAYLAGDSDHSAPEQSPFSGSQARLFVSHLALHRDLVGDVASGPSQYGVEAFVAHDSIEPSREWQQVIGAALTDCDAMVVFLHDGFNDSNWCDQEIGWAMGRNRPLLPLQFDQPPYGFMGQYQSMNCTTSTRVQIGDAITGWLTKIPTLGASLAKSLSLAFRNSGSWNFTRQLVPPLQQFPAFTEDQLARMEEAAD